MKGPPLMLIKTILLYILLVMLAESNHQVHGFDATSCAVEIQVKRHSQYKIHVGNSLTIGCPVRYCKEKPVMHWCKMEVERCVQLKVGKTEWKSNVFTLEVFSIHQNDSGLYRCRAIADNLSSESHGIQVIVEEKSANIITISPETRQKRTPLTQQRKESLVRSPAAAGTTEASEESCSLYYCSMASPMQALHGNTVYDNDVPPWNAQRTAPNAPRNDPVTPSIPVLLESPDVLTYAALNHSASAERCQRRELTVENEFTEYASINVNK
ncbi:B- and T-lymphocyte attenuator isoform X2 [Aquila chrysaetos chrysaetos]|uniref:B- and T-lymphocyte attenuator isoform X2 n=1 Tax=Aquila chrysaetos chrysaetos TaxID=223781 RepID=UPI001B7D2BE8|nr:B- and T-lymphocyte attenuator isoform X2 [Aquila chrysaetos chrysaetos]